MACPERKGRWRRRLGAAGIAAAPGRVEQRGGRRKEGGKGRMTSGTQPSVKEKEKKTGEAAWAGAGRV